MRTVVRRKAGQTAGSWDTEILSMDLSGDVGANPVLLRESPSMNSAGHASARSLGNDGFFVDSFFDVWTEISIDGGQTWIPASAPALMELEPNRQTAQISLSGPAQVDVYFEGASEGQAGDDDGDGLDEVVFRIDVAGTVLTGAGPVRIAFIGQAPTRFGTLTFPARDGVVFENATNPNEPQFRNSQIVYLLRPNHDLGGRGTLPMLEVVPALDEGMPPLDPGWSYRTVRFVDPILVAPRGFVSVRVLLQNPAGTR
ncbi:MAG: hypothetical protein K9N23_21480 [Akkermansiaceae bacterium]|nr:hypothetical protein [Akkermansiaceae bacterium]MCF7734269.1 hypothetical protein [Akkermansiaceae bacterium]